MSTPSAEKSDPALWKRIVAKVKRGTKGGDAGQWSARKAQLATTEYQKAGGGYEGGKPEDIQLTQWSEGHQDEGKEPAAKRKAAPAKGKAGAAKAGSAAAKTKSKAAASKPKEAKSKSAAKPDPVVADFRSLVNMNRTALKRWLATKRSHEVGQRKGGATQSIGHQSGEQIVELLGKKPTDAHSAEEKAHMRKVISYIKRHSAQRPEGDIKDTVWRASLMNWGHDPLKD